jgi:hypothetical protein
VTQKVPPPQDLVAATSRGWGELTTTWIRVAGQWWATILEWATDECAYSGVNQTTAYADVDETTLLRGEFYRFDPAATAATPLISSTCVTIEKTTDAALAKRPAPAANLAAPIQRPVLLITIRPGGDVVPGGYRGEVVDVATGASVAESLYVFVATDTTPP